MRDFPQTRHDMLRANYRKTGDGICKGCGAPIEWWKTTNGKSIPMNPIAGDRTEAVTHWTTCPNAKEFKGNAAAPPAPQSKQAAAGRRRPTNEEEARRLRDWNDARVVVVIDEDGTAASWRAGLPAEDLRHDLISAANFVRNEILKGEPQ